ncbi:MAG: hypothetical protein K0S74_109 [Chlamydiales bacterium]|jgi:hypothetical protein|nr:hypothetical protein [Chlamydiales bacterium]
MVFNLNNVAPDIFCNIVIEAGIESAFNLRMVSKNPLFKNDKIWEQFLQKDFDHISKLYEEKLLQSLSADSTSFQKYKLLLKKLFQDQNAEIERVYSLSLRYDWSSKIYKDANDFKDPLETEKKLIERRYLTLKKDNSLKTYSERVNCYKEREDALNVIHISLISKYIMSIHKTRKKNEEINLNLSNFVTRFSDKICMAIEDAFSGLDSPLNLNLSRNELKYMSSKLASLEHLSKLNLSNNLLDTIPIELLSTQVFKDGKVFLEGNPLKQVPLNLPGERLVTSKVDRLAARLYRSDATKYLPLTEQRLRKGRAILVCRIMQAAVLALFAWLVYTYIRTVNNLEDRRYRRYFP